MDKQHIIEEITECAKIYDKNLKNKNIMFIYIENQEVKHIETKFLTSNFMHLTGVIIKNENANSFYNKCIKKHLKEQNMEFRKDGNTQRKIEVLKRNMFINKNARLIGNYNKTNILLFSEKLIGNTYSSLGFIKNQKYYVPNTSLKKDIRKISYNNSKIICILSKDIQEKNYNEITYINKKYEKIVKQYINTLTFY